MSSDTRLDATQQLESIALPYRVSSLSEKGPVREQNEDSMVHFDSPFGHVVIVADGMGGHGHGDLAAALVVNGFQESLNQGVPAVHTPEAIKTACRTVNASILEMTRDVNQAVMGSTVVMVVIQSNQFYVAHVGDSRAYLVRDGQLTRLTKDHSVVQREVEDGLLTEEQAREDSRASMLTRALGTPDGDDIEIQGPLPLLDGDGILLCSDGLHGFVLDPQIEDAILRNNLDPHKVVKGLVNLAIGTYFSNDNVTVQYIQIGKPRLVRRVKPAFGRPATAVERPHLEPTAAALPQTATSPNRGALWVWLGLLLALVIGVLALVYWRTHGTMLSHLPLPASAQPHSGRHSASVPAANQAVRVGVLIPEEGLPDAAAFHEIKRWRSGVGQAVKLELIYKQDGVVNAEASPNPQFLVNSGNRDSGLRPPTGVSTQHISFEPKGNDFAAVYVVGRK